MKSAKNLINQVKDLNNLYSEISVKVKFSMVLMLLVCVADFFFCKFMNIVFSRVFIPEISVFLSFICMFFCFAMFFVLVYGTVALMTKLVRKEKASLGYLFLGFNTSRVTGAVWGFSGLLFLCTIIALVPVFYYVDFSEQKYFFTFLKDAELMNKIGATCLLFFIVSFVVIFFRFSFVWNLIYDDESMVELKPFVKSWKMFKGKVLYFFAFEFILCIKYLVIVAAIECVKFLQLHFAIHGIDPLFSFLLNIAGFFTVFAMFTKIAVSIPYLYESFYKNSLLKKIQN